VTRTSATRHDEDHRAASTSAKLLDDVNTALAKAAALGLGAAGQVPEKLTEEQRRR
jgi:hypothetical protein